MLEKGSFRYSIHSVLNVFVIFIAALIYYFYSPVLLFGCIISWLYFKELRDKQERKKILELQSSLDDLKNSKKN